LLRAALTVFFINMGWGLLGVGMAPLIATSFAIVSSFFLFKYYASDVLLRSAYANKKTLKMLLIYGGTTTVIIVADLLRTNIDSIVIGKFVGLEAVGLYGIAIVILRYINQLIRSAMSVLSPRFAYLDGAGKNNELRKLFLQSISISSLLSFGAGAMAILLGGHIILLWVGDDFRGALPVIIILAIGSSFALAQNPAIGLMYALNKHKFYAIVTIIEALANLTLSLILVSRYGIIGVALGTFFSMIIVKVIVMPLYVTKVANVSLYDYCRDSLNNKQLPDHLPVWNARSYASR
jgi:O-antigen/teichoic acid export membrane protein